MADSAESEPTKTTKSVSDVFVGGTPRRSPQIDDANKQPELTETILTGRAVELWSDTRGERFWIVGDEHDAAVAMERLGARRGEIYTATEVRCIVAVGDPAVVAEIHKWKREFDGVVRGLMR